MELIVNSGWNFFLQFGGMVPTLLDEPRNSGPQEAYSRTMESVWNGPRLREIIDAVGVTQAALAMRLDVRQSTIAKWVRKSNVQEPKYSAIIALSSTLGVHVDEFKKPVGSRITWMTGRKPKHLVDE